MGLKSKRIYDGIKGFSIKISVLSLLLISMIPFVELESFKITTIIISCIALAFLFIFIDMHNAFKIKGTHQTNLFFRIARFIYDRIDKFSLPLAKIKGFVHESNYIKVERHPYYNAITTIPHFIFNKFSWKKVIVIIFISSFITFGFFYYGLMFLSVIILSTMLLVGLHSLFFPALGIDNYYFNPRYEANPSVLIVGESGSGKSTMEKKLIFLLHNKVPVLTFDIHNDFLSLYNDLNLNVIRPGNNFSINLWSLEKGVSPEIRVRENIALFDSIIPQGLGKVQQSVFYKVAMNTYNKHGILMEKVESWNLPGPTNQEIIQALYEEIKESSARDKPVVSSVYRIIKLYSSGTVFGEKDQINFKDLLTKSTVIALSELRDMKMIQVIEEALLRKMYYHLLARDIQHGHVSLYVVIDELASLASNKDTSLKRLLGEGRKFGVGFILGSQLIKPLPTEIIGNCATKIFFRTGEFEDFNYIADMMASTFFHDTARKETIYKHYRNLIPLQAMIINTTHKHPYKIKVSHVNKSFKYNLIKQMNEKRKKEEKSPTQEIKQELPKESESDEVIRSIMYLLEINHGAMPKSRLLSGLKISDNKKFYDAISTLEEKGRIVEIKKENLFNKSLKWIVIDKPNKSAEHTLQVAIIYEYLLAKRFGARILDKDGVPDISIEITNGVKWAIEVETSSKKDDKILALMLKTRSKEFSETIIVTEHIERFRAIVESNNIPHCEVMPIEKIPLKFK